MTAFLVIDLPSILVTELERATTFHVLTLLIFVAAITHTLLANHFTSLSEKVKQRHREKGEDTVCFAAEVLHFLGEIEIVFALWVVPLMIVVSIFYGWDDVVSYLGSRTYVEPFFIVVVMSLCSTRPIIELAEKGLSGLARIFGGSPKAHWLSILTIAPILGSIITEAAAMTIAAVLLQKHLYIFKPSKKLAYGTLGLLFANLSVAGILTNFAAPPALTIARCWGWDAGDFFGQFGVRVLVGLALSNGLYFFFLRKDIAALKEPRTEKLEQEHFQKKVPIWVTAVHLAFLIWTIVMAHYTPVFLGGYLLFLGFHQATRPHQYELNLRGPLMVGLFLAGLVIHGGFQGWWIEPVLGDLGFGSLMLAGTVLSAFNENTTVSHLACLLENLAPNLRYAVTTGLVAGGGLTVIAHAPNPAGQSFLWRYFPKGISPWNLFLAALLPTLIFLGIFYFFPTQV